MGDKEGLEEPPPVLQPLLAVDERDSFGLPQFPDPNAPVPVKPLWLITTVAQLVALRVPGQSYRRFFIYYRIAVLSLFLMAIIIASIGMLNGVSILREQTSKVAYVAFQLSVMTFVPLWSTGYGLYYFASRPSDVEKTILMIEPEWLYLAPKLARRYTVVAAIFFAAQWIEMVTQSQILSLFTFDAGDFFKVSASTINIPKSLGRFSNVYLPFFYYLIVYTILLAIAISVRSYVVAFRCLTSQVHDVSNEIEVTQFVFEFRRWRNALSKTCAKTQHFLGPVLAAIFVGIVVSIFMSFQFSGFKKAEGASGVCMCPNGTIVSYSKGHLSFYDASSGYVGERDYSDDGISDALAVANEAAEDVQTRVFHMFLREAIRMAVFMMAPLMWIIYSAAELTALTESMLTEVNDRMEDERARTLLMPVWHLVQTPCKYTVYGVPFSKGLFKSIIVVVFSASSVVINNAI